MRANMSESAKAKDGARSAFWDYMNTATPPGSPAYNLRQIPLIASALDQSSRSTVTAEQYPQALQMARGWVAENYGQPTPKQVEEWNTARAAKKSLDNLILVELGQEGAIALRAYQSATAAAEKSQVEPAGSEGAELTGFVRPEEPGVRALLQKCGPRSGNCQNHPEVVR
jgi:hypothetical protein